MRVIHLPSQFQVTDFVSKAMSKSQCGHFMSKLTVSSLETFSLRVTVTGSLVIFLDSLIQLNVFSSLLGSLNV